MLNKLIRFSLSHRGFVLLVALILMILGCKKALEFPIDVLPDLTKPTVTLLTEAPGYAPEEVETIISLPIENAMMGVTGINRLRTINDSSLSLMFIEFDWDTDIYDARLFVQERLNIATEELPEGINPYMTPVSSLMGDIFLLGLRDPTGETEARELRSIADWVIARKLQAIPGIAEVLNMGGGIKQVQVQPNPELMLRHDITFEQLKEAIQKAVSNTTGGFISEQSQEIMVRNLAMTSDLEEIGDTVVHYEDDRAIRIKEVANVTWEVEPMRGDAGMGRASDESPKGDKGVVISIRKSPGFDSIQLSKKVEAKLEELKNDLPPGADIITLYRQADFINLAIGNLSEALRDGAIMICIILFIFLMNGRVTFITLTAIPLSLSITVLIFDLMNIGINSMTLGGVAVAIGMVVDDAIVDVENVYRRLRENALIENPREKLEVIADASSEVRSSILYASLMIILVFIPLLALSGVEGKLFTPIAIATIVSIAASFIVSLTVIPVLSSYLLKPSSKDAEKEPLILNIIKKIFTTGFLKPALRMPLFLNLVIIGLCIYSYNESKKMGGNFLPAFREPTALVAMTSAPGTSLKTTVELSQTAQNLLLEIDGVKTVGYRAGRAERGDHVVPVSTVEFDVEFEESAGRHRKEILEDVRQTMRSIPGTFSAIGGPLADRVGHMLSGVSAKIALKIYGPDLNELRRVGLEVQSLAKSIPGLEEARVEQQAPIPQLRIEIDRKKAIAYGVTPGELNEELSALIGGVTLSQIYEGARSYDLVMRLPLEWRENPARLKNLYIHTQDGKSIPLSYVANIRQASGPNTILRENTQRRFVVSINPTTDDLNQLVEELQSRVSKEITLPEGYSISFEGEYQAQQQARKTIVVSSSLILLIIIFMLYNYFKSVQLSLLVLSNIPIALIGAILFTRLTLNNISIATLVGFIAVTGIAARNNIMMVSHYLHLIRHESEGFDLPMIIRGTQERLVPVLMTALSAGIALLPLILHGEDPGKEILNPVAIVIVGGLISATAIGLIFTPSVFYHYCKKGTIKSIELKAAATD